MEEKVGMGFVPKACDRRSVKGNSVLKRAGELFWENGNVFLSSEYISESEADKLYVFFQNILHNLFL